ncbi:MAG: hypothetical protein U0J62_01165, partial [Lachnospiraceae bacterium]|nr:hypothetical protein [Lachnospiraceae bacterium]
NRRVPNGTHGGVRGREFNKIPSYSIGIGKCSYSSGTPTRIAKAILGVQSAGFALFCGNFFG